MKKLVILGLSLLGIIATAVGVNINATKTNVVADENIQYEEQHVLKANDQLTGITVSSSRYPYVDEYGIPITRVGVNFKWYYIDVYAQYGSSYSERIEFFNNDGYTVSGVNYYQPGEQVAVINYRGFSKSIPVYVVGTLDSLKIDTTNVKKEYQYGEDLDLSNLIVKAIYDNGAEAAINNIATLNGYTLAYNGFDSHIPGTYVIRVSYLDKHADFEVTVSENTEVKFDGISFIETN